ncbi:MAG: PKD domain-containing protein [Saprospiraceae bacterium]
MKKQLVSLLCLLMTVFYLGAQVTVAGRVTIGAPDGPPIPATEVVLYQFGGGTPDGVALTDEAGNYSITIDNTAAGNAEWIVETFDFCNGDVLQNSIAMNPGQQTYVSDFVVCEGINPPPPPEDCTVFFYWELQPGDEGYTVQFYDLSFLNTDADITWAWDFGDGATSAEQNPVHTYANAGEYAVTLSVSGEDCAQTLVQVVNVVDIEDCICPQVYDPVCVYTPGGLELVFDNACYAECAGYGPEFYTSCDGGGGCGCPEFFSPVCVTTPDGEVLEFVNHCFAECAGFTPDQWEDCQGNGCECPPDGEPVCVGTEAGWSIWFPNACAAECAGFTPEQFVSCGGECNCPEFYAPVCVTTDSGETLTFDNFCFAQCAGYGPDQWEDCGGNCDCPTDEYMPVCVATPGGFIITFNNPCEAECAGFGPEIYYACDGGGCACPEYYDPVCVMEADGSILEFSNPCFAACEGYTEADFVDCGNTCECDDVYEPVCVAGFAGIITFPNACYAECAGFTPDMFP